MTDIPVKYDGASPEQIKALVDESDKCQLPMKYDCSATKVRFGEIHVRKVTMYNAHLMTVAELKFRTYWQFLGKILILDNNLYLVCKIG